VTQFCKKEISGAIKFIVNSNIKFFILVSFSWSQVINFVSKRQYLVVGIFGGSGVFLNSCQFLYILLLITHPQMQKAP
jgi:hypothetical protein